MIIHWRRNNDDDGGSGGRGFDPNREPSPEVPGPARREAIVCARCLHLVALNSGRTVRNGSHVHTFANPAGHVFEIGCFNKADGCMEQGPVCMEFGWFSGYTWQVGVCGKCFAHLGWAFSSKSGDRFFGLILKQLRTLSEDD